MKKKMKIGGFLFGVIVGALLAVGVYFLTAGEVAWKEYAEKKIVPNAVLALSSVSAIYIAAQPIINGVQKSSARFDEATSNINTTVENDKNTQNALAEQDKKITSFEERFERMESSLKEAMDPIKKASENTEKIVRIGLGNTEELIKKGYAAEIGRVGKQNEQETQL